MTEYLKTVVTAVVTASVLTALLPKDGFSKYVNLIASIIVMAVIITPVFDFAPEGIELDVENLEIAEHDFVAEEFEKNLAEKIKLQLKSATGADFAVEVDATTDEIKSVRISPFSADYARITAKFTGIGEDRVMQK